jgi:hypothetical protein
MSEPLEGPAEKQAHDQDPRDERVSAPDAEDRVAVTPGLVILGLLAIALGLFAAAVMSAHSLAR